FVGPEPDRIAEEACHGAKFTTVRTAPAGLHGDNAKSAPAVAETLKRVHSHLGHEIKLTEIYLVPRNHRILLERRFAFLAEVINGSIDFFQRATRGILYNFWPGFVGFAESHSIGTAWTAIPAECLVGLFRDVGSA